MTVTTDATDHDFVVRLNRAPTDDEINRLYDIGLDDALLGGIDMYVSRTAPDLPTAVGTVVGQLTHIPGLYAVGVAPSDDDQMPPEQAELFALLDTMVRARVDATLTPRTRSVLAGLLVAPTTTPGTVFHAVLHREGDGWLAQIPELPGVQILAHGVPELRSGLLDKVIHDAHLPIGVLPDIRLGIPFDTIDPVILRAREALMLVDLRSEIGDRSRQRAAACANRSCGPRPGRGRMDRIGGRQPARPSAGGPVRTDSLTDGARPAQVNRSGDDLLPPGFLSFSGQGAVDRTTLATTRNAHEHPERTGITGLGGCPSRRKASVSGERPFSEHLSG